MNLNKNKVQHMILKSSMKYFQKLNHRCYGMQEINHQNYKIKEKLSHVNIVMNKKQHKPLLKMNWEKIANRSNGTIPLKFPISKERSDIYAMRTP